MEALLKVENLSVSYRAPDGREAVAVGGVGLQVAPGETVGLMGESGCGKSSVALAIMGLLEKERATISGSVSYRGENLVGMAEGKLEKLRGAAISLIDQQPGISLCPVMRVGAQIAEVVHGHRKWSWEKCREEAHSILARVGLQPTHRIFAAYPHELSGGQLQRVVLAQALVCGPALLLGALKQRLRMSLLLISHTPEIQASLADRLIMMRDGCVVEEGSFDRLYANPADPYTAAMLRRRPAIGDCEPAESKRMVPQGIAR
jgi:ABC-type glutathione transport system ATPase component